MSTKVVIDSRLLKDFFSFYEEVKSDACSLCIEKRIEHLKKMDTEANNLLKSNKSYSPLHDPLDQNSSLNQRITAMWQIHDSIAKEEDNIELLCESLIYILSKYLTPAITDYLSPDTKLVSKAKKQSYLINEELYPMIVQVLKSIINTRKDFYLFRLSKDNGSDPTDELTQSSTNMSNPISQAHSLIMELTPITNEIVTASYLLICFHNFVQTLIQSENDETKMLHLFNSTVKKVILNLEFVKHDTFPWNVKYYNSECKKKSLIGKIINYANSASKVTTHAVSINLPSFKTYVKKYFDYEMQNNEPSIKTHLLYLNDHPSVKTPTYYFDLLCKLIHSFQYNLESNNELQFTYFFIHRLFFANLRNQLAVHGLT
jgi:hypothetical protein